MLGLLFASAALARTQDDGAVVTASAQSAPEHGLILPGAPEASTAEVAPGDFRLLEEQSSGSGSGSGDGSIDGSIDGSVDGSVDGSPSSPPSPPSSAASPAPPPFTPDSEAAYAVTVTVRVFDYDLDEDAIKTAFAEKATALLEAANVTDSEVTADDVIITGVRITDGDDGARSANDPSTSAD